MKTFLSKISLYIFSLVILFLLLGSYADGNTDDNYLKFTTPKSNALLLGTSRASQGLVPGKFNQELNRKDFINFAFTIATSPYGPTYLKAIKRKVNSEKENGVFILAVDPWSISRKKNTTIEKFKEEESYTGNMYFSNISPNYEYLLKNYPYSWFNIYRDNHIATGQKSATFVKDDGWIEVDISIEKDSIKKRELIKFKGYNKIVKNTSISSVREKYLVKTIEYLQQYGKVYLVRLPQKKEIRIIENKLDKNFNTRIQKIANQTNCTYFNYIEQGDDYKYTDGNHLYKESSKRISTIIAKDIKKSLNNP